MLDLQLLDSLQNTSRVVYAKNTLMTVAIQLTDTKIRSVAAPTDPHLAVIFKFLNLFFQLLDGVPFTQLCTGSLELRLCLAPTECHQRVFTGIFASIV